MILPKALESRHKIRDAKILQLYLSGKTQAEIGKHFQLTETRIGQILYKNRNLLLGDIRFEKAKRINYYKRQILNEDGSIKKSEKDPADLVESIRKEYEGDSQVSVVTQFLNITPNDSANNSRLKELA